MMNCTIKSRFSLILTASIVLTGLHTSLAQSWELNNQNLEGSVVTKNLAPRDSALVFLIANNAQLQNYLKEGKLALKQQDYQTAWQKFKKALDLNPKNIEAQKGVRETEGYAYDLFMQAGYKADRVRDYQKALQNFEQASLVRPDAFYAKQAVNNVKKYLNHTVSSTQENNGSWKSILFWSFLGLISLSVLGTGLFLIFKSLSKQSNKSSLEEPDFGANYIDRVAEKSPERRSRSLVPEQVTVLQNSAVELIDREEITLVQKEQGSNNDSSSLVSQKNLTKSEVVPNSSSQSLAIQTTASVSKVDPIAELIKDLHQTDLARRKKAIWELAQRSDSRAMKPLVDLMVEADSHERSLILEAVAQIATRTLKPMNKALAISLEDENAQVRKNAIRDLTKVYELISQVNQRLSHCVDDPDIEVRETAKWALRQLDRLPRMSNLEGLNGTKEDI